MPSEDRDKLSIVIGGTAFDGWLDVDLDSDIMTAADSFSLSAAIPSKDSRAKLVKGAKCEIYIGGNRQMSGFIDKPSYSGDRAQSRVRISGQDKGGYLVKSEADAILAEKYTVETLIDKLLDPSFGIDDIINSNEANRTLQLGKEDKRRLRAKTPSTARNKPRKSTKIDPGQTIAQILDEHTRRLNLTWWMTAKGELFIGKPNYNQDVAFEFNVAALGDRLTTAHAVESWSVEDDIADRYSEITVNGSGFGEKGETFDTSKAEPRFTYTVTDLDLVSLGIVRKLVLADYDITTQEEAQKRAEYEMGKRRFMGLSINLTVPGFRQGDRLYTVDTLASVRIPEADIDGVYYVTQRRFTESRGTRRTQLTLRPKGLWLA